MARVTGEQRASRAFPPEPRSARDARHFVREVLQGSSGEQWLDAALLAVSEVATNALQHAHTSFEVTVRVEHDGVYVQVRDHDPTLPARRSSDGVATTGRGMALVSAVATAHGVQQLGPLGKVVWFCVGMARPDQGFDGLVDTWDDRGWTDERPDDRGVQVHLLGLPLRLWLAAREHHNTLLREYSLWLRTGPTVQQEVAERLVLADRARSHVLQAFRDSTVGASAQQDLAFVVRPHQRGWFVALRDLLDDAEALAAAGQLLARPGAQALVDVRRWACREVVDQSDGHQARRWTGPLEATGHPLSLEQLA